jgi:hypothetical protein
MGERLDEAGLVWAAALVTGAAPADVVDAVDVAALSALVAEVDAIHDPVRAAAHLLARVVLERPFPMANAAIGWLATVELLQERGLHTAARPRDVVELCAAIRAGRADVAAQLRRWSTRSGFRCPACDRTVYEFSATGPRVLHGTSRAELTARCAFEHRSHDRHGGALATSSPSPIAPAVLARGDCGSVAVAVDGRTLVLSPYCDEPAIYRVSEVGEVSPGDLVGRWDALVARATTVGFVPADDLGALV